MSGYDLERAASGEGKTGGILMLYPLKAALERVERAKADSDASLFFELLYLGEFVLKTTAAGFIAAIDDDRDGHRYRLTHKLVRADGIGRVGAVP